MEYKLEELFELQMGKTPSRDKREYWENGRNKWISIADLSKSGKYICETKEHLSDKALTETRISPIPENTVVMSFKLSIGKIAITSETMYSNEAIMAFRDSHKVKLLPEYVYYLLMAHDWNAGTNKAVMGKTLNKATLSKTKVNVHSYEKQLEIVQILNQITNIIEVRNQQLEWLEKMVQARFVEMFGDVKINQHNYKKVKIKQVLKSCEAGWSGNGTQRVKKDDEIAVLKVSAVTKGYFIPEECKVLDDQENIKKYVTPEKGDLLFSRANTREMVGATAIVREDYPTLILPDKLWKIRFNDSANVFYMKYVLSSKSIRNEFSASSTGTSGSMFNVSMDKFKEIEIPIAPIELQNQFADFVQAIDKSKLQYHPHTHTCQPNTS